MQFFQHAIDLDPNYADAYNGLAYAYFFSGARIKDPGKKIKEAAEKAISLGLKAGDAHRILFLVNFFYEWNWKEAKAQHEKWLQYNSPGLTTQAYYLALLYGDFDQAIVEQKEAIKKDPLITNWWMNLAEFYTFNKQYSEARRCLNKALEIDPLLGGAYTRMGWCDYWERKYDLALANFRKANEFSEDNRGGKIQIAIALAASGQMKEAEDLLQYTINSSAGLISASLIAQGYFAWSSPMKLSSGLTSLTRIEKLEWLELR